MRGTIVVKEQLYVPIHGLHKVMQQASQNIRAI